MAIWMVVPLVRGVGRYLILPIFKKMGPPRIGFKRHKLRITTAKRESVSQTFCLHATIVKLIRVDAVWVTVASGPTATTSMMVAVTRIVRPMPLRTLISTETVAPFVRTVSTTTVMATSTTRRLIAIPAVSLPSWLMSMETVST